MPKAIARDYRTAGLDRRDVAMLEYAVHLTRSPHTVTERDVERLRSAGFDDTGVLDVCQIVSYYNYVNRLADGLGVELENSWHERDLTMTRADFTAVMAARESGSQPHE